MLGEILKLGKESVIYGLSTVLARLLNFLLVPVYTYFLATGEYGAVSAVFSYIAFFNIIYQFGMDQAFLRFGNQGEDKDVFSTCFWAVGGVSLFLSLIIFSSKNYLAGISGIGAENSFFIACSAAVLLLDALTIVPFAKLRLQHKPWKFAGIRAVSIIVNVASNIILLSCYKMGGKAVFISAVMASLASLTLLLPEIISSLKLKFSRDIFTRCFGFAWHFVPAGIFAMVVQVADRPILLFLSTKENAGIYQANYKMGIFLMLFVSMFDQAWRPFFLERAKLPNAKEVFARVLTYFSLTGVFIFLALSFFLADIIKMPIFGYHLIHPEYWGGLGIIPVILAGYLMYGLYINFIAAPILSGRTALLSWATAAGAGLNIAVNIVLIPLWGIYGSAWATFISYFAMAAILFALSRKIYPIQYEWGRLGKIALSAFVAGVFYFALQGYAPPMLLKTVLLGGFVLSFLFTGFLRAGEMSAVRAFFSRR